MSGIHPTALVHAAAVVPADVEVGPYAVIDAEVIIGAGARIGPFCHLYPGVQLGAETVLSDGVVLGNAPQDLKYRGETTRVHVGRGTVLREYVTVNRGTIATGLTRIGDHCLVMAYSHVAHDCELGDQVIVANGVQMGGHVHIGAAAVISGLTGIHQFVTIGPGVFVGGGLRVEKDVPPFSKALGEPLAWAGVNEIGLTKLGFGGEDPQTLKAFYRLLFAQLGEGLSPAAVAETVLTGAASFAGDRMPGLLRQFFQSSRRGLLIRRAASGI